MPFFSKQTIGANSPSRIAAPVTSNIGEALGAVGQAGAELYERIQVSKDKDTSAQAAEASLAMKTEISQGTSELKIDAQTNGDYDGLPDRTSEFLMSVRDKYYSNTGDKRRDEIWNATIDGNFRPSFVNAIDSSVSFSAEGRIAKRKETWELGVLDFKATYSKPDSNPNEILTAGQQHVDSLVAIGGNEAAGIVEIEGAMRDIADTRVATLQANHQYKLADEFINSDVGKTLFGKDAGRMEWDNIVAESKYDGTVINQRNADARGFFADMIESGDSMSVMRAKASSLDPEMKKIVNEFIDNRFPYEMEQDREELAIKLEDTLTYTPEALDTVGADESLNQYMLWADRLKQEFKDSGQKESVYGPAIDTKIADTTKSMMDDMLDRGAFDELSEFMENNRSTLVSVIGADELKAYKTSIVNTKESVIRQQEVAEDREYKAKLKPHLDAIANAGDNKTAIEYITKLKEQGKINAAEEGVLDRQRQVDHGIEIDEDERRIKEKLKEPLDAIANAENNEEAISIIAELKASGSINAREEAILDNRRKQDHGPEIESQKEEAKLDSLKQYTDVLKDPSKIGSYEEALQHVESLFNNGNGEIDREQYETLKRHVNFRLFPTQYEQLRVIEQQQVATAEQERLGKVAAFRGEQDTHRQARKATLTLVNAAPGRRKKDHLPALGDTMKSIISNGVAIQDAFDKGVLKPAEYIRLIGENNQEAIYTADSIANIQERHGESSIFSGAYKRAHEYNAEVIRHMDSIVNNTNLTPEYKSSVLADFVGLIQEDGVFLALTGKELDKGAKESLSKIVEQAYDKTESRINPTKPEDQRKKDTGLIRNSKTKPSDAEHLEQYLIEKFPDSEMSDILETVRETYPDYKMEARARQGGTGMPLLDAAIQTQTASFQQDERLQPAPYVVQYPQGKNMDALEKSIREHEGEKRNKDGKHVVYEDSEGFPTVGYGHKVTSADGLKLGDTIDDAKAEQLFKKDIERAKSGAKTVVKNFDALPNEARHILTEMVYQMGVAGVKKFEYTIEHIEAGDYDKAAKEMLNSEWAKQTPNRAKALAERMERLT